MMLSSGEGGNPWSVGSEGSAVAQQSPQDVDEPTGQGEQGLFVHESFAAFPVVERARGPAGFEAGQGGHVEHAAQAPVVAFSAPEVSGDAAGIAWYGDESGVGGQ